MIPDVSPERLIDALRRFDQELRATTDASGWEERGPYKYAIEFEGRRYPVKKIVSLATGVPVLSFSGGQEANTYVEKRGLSVIRIGEPSIESDPNPIRSALEKILAGYVRARSEDEFRRTHGLWPVFEGLRRALAMSSAIAGRAHIKVTWAMGQGNWARIPWVSILDTRETETMQRGVYCVFLFRQDMSGVYLTLAQGVTEPVRQYGRAKGRAWLREQAAMLRARLLDLSKNGFELDDKIDLKTDAGLGTDYEDSTIVHKLYMAGSLPSDDAFLADLEPLLAAYDRVVTSKPDSGGRGVKGAGGRSALKEDSFGLLLTSLKGSRLTFGDEVVSNYVLALQTKRFVILTGISGTGKTSLATGVAKHFHSSIDEQPFHLIAVRPDWTDSRALLGYLNPIDGCYVPTRLVQTLLRARDESQAAVREGRAASPFFVILDEMNLARVEHYFSDFLSCLESGDALDLHPLSEATTGQGEGATAIPGRLYIPENVYFTGTVNIDETTYMFSPKVLDRAFTMELADVDLSSYPGDDAEGGVQSPLYLTSFPGQLIPFRRPTEDDWVEFGQLVGGELRRITLDLHQVLGEEGRHFGYRVANEISRFVLLAADQTAGSPEALWTALDLAIYQKVLPKCHGTQQELDGPLTRLFAFAIAGQAAEPDVAGFAIKDWELYDGRLRLRATPASGASQPRLQRTAAKIFRMTRRLRDQGFTSFIE